MSSVDMGCDYKQNYKVATARKFILEVKTTFSPFITSDENSFLQTCRSRQWGFICQPCNILRHSLSCTYADFHLPVMHIIIRTNSNHRTSKATVITRRVRCMHIAVVAVYHRRVNVECLRGGLNCILCLCSSRNNSQFCNTQNRSNYNVFLERSKMLSTEIIVFSWNKSEVGI